MATSVPRGCELLRLLTQEPVRGRIIEAARAGRAPVSAISEPVLALIGPDEARKTVVRQFLGTCVRAILAEENFTVARERVRVPGDPIFKTGATYRASEEAQGDILERMLASLSRDEMLRAVQTLKRHLRRLE